MIKFDEVAKRKCLIIMMNLRSINPDWLTAKIYLNMKPSDLPHN
jgi:hypothetical protein